MTSRWLSFAVAVVVTLLSVPGGPARASEPIKIGYLGPLTGIFAQSGKEMLDGLKLALDQANNEAAGRKIELIAEDTEGNPATALAKYRKLTTHDKIHVLSLRYLARAVAGFPSVSSAISSIFRPAAS